MSNTYTQEDFIRDIEADFQDINEIINDFNKNLGEKEGSIDSFENLPQNMQIVLIDMVYNLGKEGFNWKTKKVKLSNGKEKSYGYPSFWKAFARRNVDGMVKECVRNKNDAGFIERNRETQELIRQTPKSWTKNALKK